MNYAFTFIPIGRLKEYPNGKITLHIGGEKMPYEYRRQHIPEERYIELIFIYNIKMPKAEIDLIEYN